MNQRNEQLCEVILLFILLEILAGGAPRAVVEELDFGAVFLDVEDGDAGVAEFEGGHLV